MNQPLVSIIIPVYNREKIIAETLESAIAQTYRCCEIVVVDNKSSDRTFSILTEYAYRHSNMKIFQNETNLGPVRNWVKCLEYATGEYIKILWSDDLLDPRFVEQCLPFLRDNLDVGFVFTRTRIFNTEKAVSNEVFLLGKTGLYSSDTYIRKTLFGWTYPLSPGCAMFRRRDLSKNLLIDIPNDDGKDFSLRGAGNDMMIFLLTAKEYRYFAFLNETLSFFRDHEGSITVSAKQGEVTRLYLLAKLYYVKRYSNDMFLKWLFYLRVIIEYLWLEIKFPGFLWKR